MGQGEILFEFVQVGRQMRVAAFDVDSGIEVVVITPLTANKYQMQQLALIKLRKKLAEAQPLPAPPPPGRFA